MKTPENTVTVGSDWQTTKSNLQTGLELSEVEDTYLVMGCIAGDEAAWVALLERHGPVINTIARNFHFPLMTIEEIFQDVCVQLIRKLDTIQDPSKLHAWIVTTTKRICLKRQEIIRKTSTEGDVPPTFTSDDIGYDERLILGEDFEILQSALSQLDERCRTLIDALFLREPHLSYDKLASELGIAEGSVGPIRSRCLERLRTIVLELQNKTEL